MLGQIKGCMQILNVVKRFLRVNKEPIIKTALARVLKKQNSYLSQKKS